ncbi:hypothetical protein LQW54_002137 [Pestalotiopsis sp. IQ-011]
MPATARAQRSTRRDLGGRQAKAPAQHDQNGGAKAQSGQHRGGRSTRNYSALTAAAAATEQQQQQAHIAEPATRDPTTTTTRPGRRNSARMKRPLDLIHPNPDPTKVKRSRITVEIKSLAKLEPPSPSRTIVVRPPPLSSAADVTPQQNKPPPPSSLPTPPSVAAPAAEPAILPKTAQKEPTVHQKKVYNGIRHELDRLQPSVADAGQAKEESSGGRKLRSQEATRFKSELSAYFPDYDEVIGNDAKEYHVLNVDTPILVVDSSVSPHHNVRTSHPRQAAVAAAAGSSKQNHHSKVDASTTVRSAPWISKSDNYHVKHYGDDLYNNLYNAERLYLPGLQARSDDLDPLPDSLYETAHRRAERLEKTIRNTEKGRAQHERDQIVRLLGELQGPDWLRTMGVNGVTESKKKSFEFARSHFIRGCEGILEKFRWWAQEERKRKLERDRALAEEAASSEPEDDEEEEDEEDADEEEIPDSDADDEMYNIDSANQGPADDKDGDPPDLSDVDAHVTKQLHEEALARVKRPPSVSSKKPRRDMSPSPVPQPPREFKSFFEKRHDRDVALSKVRRSRRVALAWGHMVPETVDEDFELQPEYMDEETMQTRERRKRRDRRNTHR